MHSTKQSNWILGFGVVVAILLIVTTIWFNVKSDNSSDTVINKAVPDFSQVSNQVQVKALGWLGSMIKILN